MAASPFMKKDNSDFWSAVDELVRSHRIIIDRPSGSAHPRFPDMIYPADYGYLESTHAMDGGGIDIWRGTEGHLLADAILCVLDLMKSDAEIKILIGCTREEKQMICRFQNSSTHMKVLLIERV